MNPRTSGIFIGTMVIATFATGVLVYPHLPLVAASHWDALGQVNGFLPRFWAAFLLPGILLIFSGLWALLPRIDPIAPGFTSFRYVYDFFWILIIAFLAFVYALSLGANLGWQVSMTRVVIPAVGALFIIIGALLPLMKRNWFIGIRTPWTLSSDVIWDTTHRLASKLFMLAGAISLGAAFAAPRLAFWLVIAPVLLAAFASVIYSYVLFARTKRP